MTANRRRGRRAAARPRAAPLGVAELTVESLGARGDGIARHDGRAVYIPYALPGERLRVRLDGRRGDGLAGEAAAILEASAQRVAPACRHFADPAGACGGCTLQHLSAEGAADFKRRLVAESLARRGFDTAVVMPTVAIPPGQRRRADFAVAGGRGAPRVGFHEAESHRIVDIAECPALMPELAALVPKLRTLLAGIAAAGRGGAVEATRTETGLDVVLTLDGEPSLAERRRLADFSNDNDIARLSWRGGEDEPPLPVMVRRAPIVSFSGTPVAPPAGVFLQASGAGERAIVEAIMAGLAGRLPGEARIADLFAGCGTLTFALARLGHVRAYEGDEAMVATIARAAGQAGLGGRVTAERRDLFRRPLAGRELGGLDAVVFDPPRAGAAEQARAIAEAGAPRTVVAVSCAPASFARDARVLADGGYRLESVVPIDQFPWSAHVELVAVLTRGPGAAGG